MDQDPSGTSDHPWTRIRQFPLLPYSALPEFVPQPIFEIVNDGMQKLIIKRVQACDPEVPVCKFK